MTLRDRLDTRDNALNFLRLILAGLVIVSHTWPLGGFGDDPHLGDMSLGAFSVAGFFVISGYLIAGSRMRLSLGQFALRRGLRILPGFWVCLVVVAFVFAPLTALGTGTPFDLTRAASFVWLNATTVMSQWAIGGELGSAPYPAAWDGSLWTLQYELLCYALTGLALCWGWARRHVTWTTVAALVILTAVNVALTQAGLARGTLVDFVRLAVYFAAGSLLWSLRDKIRVNRWWVAAAALVLVAFMAAGVAHEVGALPLAYLMLTFGAWCPLQWGVDRDLSYGVYVYAFPVQQVLALAGVQRFGPTVFIACAVALVLPLSWLSWTLVERPSLRLARRRGSPVAALADGPLHGASTSGAHHRAAQAVVALDLTQGRGARYR
jgi:peptidoglycan/LPS O-acetylase OafA/YrhL